MKMSRQHFDFIADTVGPMVGWPSQLHDLADKLASSNPKFNREKFISRDCFRHGFALTSQMR